MFLYQLYLYLYFVDISRLLIQAMTFLLNNFKNLLIINLKI